MDEQELGMVLQQVRRFVRDAVIPLEDRIEQDDEIPTDIVQQAKDMGLFGFAIPERFGGLGLTMSQEVRLAFELSYTGPSLRSQFGTNNGIAGQVLLMGGTDQQQQQFLPKLASGELISAFALTEDQAGSDPAGLTTRAVRDGQDWIINGAKRFITNAPIADVLMVFARTDPDAAGSRGISVFLVPRDTDGITIAPKDVKMGQRGAWTADVHLDNVRVGPDMLIGGEAGQGRGFTIALRCLSHGRLHIGAVCVGIAQRLMDESVSYAATRVQGGKPIGQHQLVQGMLADSYAELSAARSMVLQLAEAYDRGEDRRAGPAAVKYFCSEMLGRVADRAVQIHGGYGYMRGYAVERLYRDARLFRIYEGTSQIQQLIIARELINTEQQA